MVFSRVSACGAQFSQPPFQSKAGYFYSHANNTHFQMKCFGLSLALKNWNKASAVLMRALPGVNTI